MKKIEYIVDIGAEKSLVQFNDSEKIVIIESTDLIEELNKQFSLNIVSHRRELLLFMEHLSTYHGIDEVIDCTKHQHIIEQYEK